MIRRNAQGREGGRAPKRWFYPSDQRVIASAVVQARPLQLKGSWGVNNLGFELFGFSSVKAIMSPPIAPPIPITGNTLSYAEGATRPLVAGRGGRWLCWPGRARPGNSDLERRWRPHGRTQGHACAGLTAGRAGHGAWYAAGTKDRPYRSWRTR